MTKNRKNKKNWEKEWKIEIGGDFSIIGIKNVDLMNAGTTKEFKLK